MMNKLLVGAVVVILLVVAVEGGYYWGLRKGPSQSSCPICSSTNSSSEVEKQKPGTTISAFLPFVDEKVTRWVSILPNSAVFGSTWGITLVGSYVARDETSITIENFEGTKRIELPPGSPGIEFSKYLEANKQIEPATSDEIQPSDSVSIIVRFNTLNGTVESIILSKFISAKVNPPTN